MKRFIITALCVLLIASLVGCDWQSYLPWYATESTTVTTTTTTAVPDNWPKSVGEYIDNLMFDKVEYHFEARYPFGSLIWEISLEAYDIDVEPFDSFADAFLKDRDAELIDMLAPEGSDILRTAREYQIENDEFEMRVSFYCQNQYSGQLTVHGNGVVQVWLPSEMVPLITRSQDVFDWEAIKDKYYYKQGENQ